MKVFMNKQGKFLNWWRAEIGGFVAGSHWDFWWEDSIHEAKLALFIPCSAQDKWRDKRNPKLDVAVELEATVETTRIVTIVMQDNQWKE
jgi:hypothetical protein